MKISIVIPCYNESKNLIDLRSRFSVLPLFEAGLIELVLVDDGSADDTWQKISDWAVQDYRVVAVRLLANCGNQQAMLNGILVAHGDYIAVMDADLQDPPEVIEKMQEEMISKNVVAVVGVKLNRHDNNRLLSLLKAIAIFVFPLKQGEGDFCLLKKEIAKEILNIGNPAMPFRVRRFWATKKREVEFFPYNRSRRMVGTTKFNLKKLIKLWWLSFKGFYLSFGRESQSFEKNIKDVISKNDSN